MCVGSVCLRPSRGKWTQEMLKSCGVAAPAAIKSLTSFHHPSLWLPASASVCVCVCIYIFIPPLKVYFSMQMCANKSHMASAAYHLSPSAV